jgi:PAS domain S-box-containing protein
MTNESIANILIVDDDSRSLTAMEALLVGPRRRIVCAASGNDALRCLLREDFALILLDVRLPDINGFEVAELIRGTERLRNIPIIFLSAIDTLEEDVFKGTASGAVDYLFKPVMPQVLQGKVSVFINLYHMNEQLKRRAVHESEERFRLVVESIRDHAIFQLDPSGNITMSNSASERMRGWKTSEILGQPFSVFFTAEDRATGKPREILMRTAVDGRYQEEAWCARKDGSTFLAEVVYARVLDETGRLVGFSGIARDLTEPKRAERELQRLKAELETRAAELAQREKLQQQLLQSQKMESIGALAAGVTPSGGGETILFVDDEENQLQLMRRFLESEGYKVSAAKDGAEAVELFLKNKDSIDLAVLDVRLPKLNGWEAFQKMREARPEIKALFATGLLSPEMEAEIVKGDLGGIILKPYKLEVVLQKIVEVLRQTPTPSVKQQGA